MRNPNIFSYIPYYTDTDLIRCSFGEDMEMQVILFAAMVVTIGFADIGGYLYFIEFCAEFFFSVFTRNRRTQ